MPHEPCEGEENFTNGLLCSYVHLDFCKQCSSFHGQGFLFASMQFTPKPGLCCCCCCCKFSTLDGTKSVWWLVVVAYCTFQSLTQAGVHFSAALKYDTVKLTEPCNRSDALARAAVS